MIMAMRPITEVMRLLQFGDSVLPVGSFSFSNGLEPAIQQEVVRDPDSLRQFIQTVLAQAATTDGIALLEAHRAASAADLDRIVRADQALFLRKLNEEMRTMTVRMGRKLGELAKHVAPAPLAERWLLRIERGETPGTFPVGLALVFQGVGLDERDAFAAHQYGLATMMVGAAVRLMKLNYLDAQAILFDINAAAGDAYERVASAALDDMAAFAPVADILAAIHVKSHVRMFMN
jgi:urease accessory protein